MSKNSFVKPSWLMFIFASAGLLQAQVGVDVTVLNNPGQIPATGVEVRIENPNIGYRSSAMTNGLGKVRFSGLTTTGTFTLWVAGNEQFYEARITGVRTRANYIQSVTLLRVPRQIAEETLVVTNGFAEVNGLNAEVSATLRETEIKQLPVEGRDITRALFRLPNVTQATGFFPEAPNVSINGANALYTNYMIDGLDNNENFLGGQKFPIPVGFARDITVLTNNYSTEFGRTGNGVFNITTKSGGNQLEGEVFFVNRPGPSLDASSPHAQRDLSGNQVRDGFRRDQAGFALGGPIVKDKTFFFVNFEQTEDDKDNLLSAPALGVSESVAGQNSFSYLSTKLDHYWSPSFSSSLRANLSLVEIQRQGGGLEGGATFPSAGNRQDRNSAHVAFANTYVGDGFVYEGNLQFSRFRWDYGEPFNGPSPQVTVLDATGVTAAVLGHPGFIFDSLEETIQIQQKLSFQRGNHTLKVGADLITADFQLLGGGNVNGNYLVQLTQAQQDQIRASGVGGALDINDIPGNVQVVDYAVELQPRAFGTAQDLYSVYVEDLWAVNSKLDLTFGLRYDFDSLTEAGGVSGDNDNIAPRFSFNYAPDEKSAIRGGYGIFYEKLPYAIYSDALQQNSSADGFRQQLQELIDLGILPANTNIDDITFDGNLVVNPTGVTYLQGPTPDQVSDLRETAFSNERRVFNPNGWENPYTHQLSLGYQRQLRDDLLFYVDLMITRSENLVRLRNLNAAEPFALTPDQIDGITPDQARDLVRTPEEADATRPVAPVAGGARNIIISETEGSSHYKAATFNLLKERGDDPFAYRVSYTLSRLRNNTEDINFRAQNANIFDSEWGPSVNDRTHVISAVASYFPLKKLSITLAALIQSGQPINRIPDASFFGTTDLNGDGRAFSDAYQGNSDRHPGEARNSDRLPWSEVLDLGIAYDLSWDRHTIQVRADVFNLFNTENLSGYSNNATQSNQIQVGPAGSGRVTRNAGPPRQFQFTARYVF